jgi:hypothetical protein
MNAAILLHGGTMSRRAALSRAVREAHGLDSVRVRLSSSAAEAAKCLADPAVCAIFLLDAPRDADMVRDAATVRSVRMQIYELEPRDAADVFIALVRRAIPGSDQPVMSTGVSDHP